MLELVLLAVVQGIAEFLPISSSGHLVILGAAIGKLSESPTLEIILHAGTLGSILVIFWRRILELMTRDSRVIPLLVVGTFPAALVGLIIKTRFEHLLRSPTIAGAMLLITAAMLLLLGRLASGEGDYRAITPRAAFLIGCFQAFALLPGISRSGATIFAGRLMGLKKDDAITFSFLLAIPAILGATMLAALELWVQRDEPSQLPYSSNELVVGALISFAVGVVALRWLIGWSRLDRLQWFAWWCIPVGLAAIAHFGLGFGFP